MHAHIYAETLGAGGDHHVLWCLSCTKWAIKNADTNRDGIKTQRYFIFGHMNVQVMLVICIYIYIYACDGVMNPHYSS